MRYIRIDMNITSIKSTTTVDTQYIRTIFIIAVGETSIDWNHFASFFHGPSLRNFDNSSSLQVYLASTLFIVGVVAADNVVERATVVSSLPLLEVFMVVGDEE